MTKARARAGDPAELAGLPGGELPGQVAELVEDLSETRPPARIRRLTATTARAAGRGGQVTWHGAHSAGRWLAAGGGAPTRQPRIADETLQRFLIWCGVDLRLPVQFHVGYGDSDVDLHRCNPLLLTPLLRAIEPTGVPVMLLHNYPYHREAGYLAQVFPHVYVDAGLATHNLGARAPALLAEALELTPYGKFLYSSDAFGLPELYYLSAALFRRALSDFLRAGIEEDLYSERTVVRLTRMLCADNAKRAYQLGGPFL